jgi:hypothetical protein
MFKRCLAALACTLAVSIGAQVTPASASQLWLWNRYGNTVQKTTNGGVVYINGFTESPNTDRAIYYYQLLSYDGVWHSSEPFQAIEGDNIWRARFEGVPAGVTVRVRANAYVAAFTVY